MALSAVNALSSSTRVLHPRIQYTPTPTPTAATGPSSTAVAVDAPDVTTIRVGQGVTLGTTRTVVLDRDVVGSGAVVPRSVILPPLPPPFVTPNGKLVNDDRSSSPAGVDTADSDVPVTTQLTVGCEALSVWCHTLEEEVSDALVNVFQPDSSTLGGGGGRVPSRRVRGRG